MRVRLSVAGLLIVIGLVVSIPTVADANSAINQPLSSTQILVPSSGATLSGSTYLDASASNATSVEFLLFGGVYGFSAPTICTTTPTLYGWLCAWNTTMVPNGSYVLVSEAFNSAGSTLGAGVSITVKNPLPTTTVLVPSKGATLSGSTYLDASASNATSVEFLLFGGVYGFSAPTICTTTSTLYGWLCAWDTTTVPNGSYVLVSEAFNSAGSTFSSGVNVTVNTTSNATLPDLQIKVPTNLMSIGTVNGQRQLQFTHITWDAGAGPFEIDPTYNSATGTSSFVQAIYRSPSPGVWTYDHSVPVAATGVWNPPSDYQFPLTRFTLNTVNPDGSLGAVVATSPKVDYCMTADTYVGGVSNTPNSSYIPQDNCATPTLPLGWSVGWGDQYDQTDSGQPISLTGIADGTYILHATVDPNHVLTESNTANNVTDTLLQISGNTVTVVSQTNPGTTPPSVAVTSPASGASVSGTVTLTASASATAPATITSVQFLLDGANLGSPVTTAPYSYSWNVGSTALGSHNLSARVTDSSGNVATAPTVPITVVSGGGSGCGTTPPTIAITNPTLNQTVSGTAQPVAATATAMGGATIASVQFLLDGANLGSPVTAAPYAVTWNTTTASGGTHTLSARAIDSCGNLGAATAVTVTVQNPAPPMTCFVLQSQQSTHGSGNVTTPVFHTAAAGEVLVAFVSANGPSGAGTQTVKVSGAGLTWTLVKRANAQSGDAEAWTANAPNVLSSATVTSTEAQGGYSQDLTVIAMEGVGGVGASVAGSGATGAPSLTLTTTASTSLVFAVGDDWDNAVGRTLPGGWVFLDQWVNTGAGDTYWTQYTNTPTGAAGSVIPVGDLGPTSDQWNLVAIELTNSG